jgi:RimJ/RimL family protein N-acetyltransferase
MIRNTMLMDQTASPVVRTSCGRIRGIEPLDIPQIETDRTVMRGWRPDDVDPYGRWMADPEVSRYIGGMLDAEQAWRSVAAHIGHWQLRGYGQWAVERKEDQALIGRVGLWNPGGWVGLEVGWTLRRDAWGRGYAQETAHAAIQWAWDNLATEALISVIDPRNAASIKVAERLGMHFRRDQLLRGTIPVQIYEIRRRPPGRRRHP